MITIDELKVQLADYAKAVKDLEEALAIEAQAVQAQRRCKLSGSGGKGLPDRGSAELYLPAGLEPPRRVRRAPH